MLTGKAPFQGDTPMDVMLRHILEAPTPPRALVPAISHSIEKAVLTAMAKDPTKRWPRAGLFVQALDAAASPGMDTISLSDLPRMPGLASSPPSPARLLGVAAVSAVIGFGGVGLARRLLIPPPSRATMLPVSMAPLILAASNHAMDEGAYPKALQLAELAAYSFPENRDAQSQSARVQQAWDEEIRLGLWSPPPAPPAAQPQPRPSGVDATGERH
jgi:serine/threonine protein kinase